MLKFKNKFKFGLSEKSPNPSSTISPTPSNKGTSSEKSPESRKTLTNELSDNMSKLTLGETDAVNTGGDAANASHGQIYGSENGGPSALYLNAPPAESNITTNSSSSSSQHTTVSSNKQQGSSTEVGSSSSSSAIDSSSDGSSPGLLTVKIYNSNNIQLPIKINNSKQILHALAINSNNESTSQQLLKHLSTLDNTEGDDQFGDYLPGTIATNFLPSIITIPNAENLVKSLLYLTIEFDNNVLVIEPLKGTVNKSTWNQVVSFDVTKKSQGTTTNGDKNGDKNGNKNGETNEPTGSSFLNLNLFIRLPNMLIPDTEKI
ncbi:Serine/threonine-protein kinase YPK2/YKR2 [Spathaspora sp. JA1]|nr:Serine/threonine-protein kinase YPK2/YKR2 [Spathaspora sp. JA1]